VPTGYPPGWMIALAGDAELDEGNIFEALLEGWKHDVRNLWWVIDYNRQGLDAVVSDRLFGRIDALFEMMGWRVVTLKYGRLLEAAFARPDGHHLREWIDACPNSLYSALVYKGGEGWRKHLRRDLNLLECSAQQHRELIGIGRLEAQRCDSRRRRPRLPRRVAANRSSADQLGSSGRLGPICS
jgi:pyruvate dehydrogenase complex dehydrogenase (E1) component